MGQRHKLRRARAPHHHHDEAEELARSARANRSDSAFHMGVAALRHGEPRAITSAAVPALQRRLGNRALQRLAKRGGLATSPRPEEVETDSGALGTRRHASKATDGKRQPALQGVIQRWPPAEHRKLTLEGVKKRTPILPGFSLDETTARELAGSATQMDLKLPELWFNFGGKIKGSFLGGIDKKKRMERLVRYYRKNPERALNHGEGGFYDTPESAASPSNIRRHKRYEKQARNAFKLLSRKFRTSGECSRTKAAVKHTVLATLGDALHVAQDRGSHGEGGDGKGHAGEIFTGKSPDKPANNPGGYLKAQRNTELLLLEAYDILDKILDKRYDRTISYTHRAE